jgi:hypothetical protein
MNIKDLLGCTWKLAWENRYGKLKRINLAEFWAGSLERCNGRSYVLVLGFGFGYKGASPGSAGLCSFQAILWLNSGGSVCRLCVWLVWRCVKIGLICCCWFVDEIRRVRCPVSGFRWYVPNGGLVWTTQLCCWWLWYIIVGLDGQNNPNTGLLWKAHFLYY